MKGSFSHEALTAALAPHLPSVLRVINLGNSTTVYESSFLSVWALPKRLVTGSRHDNSVCKPVFLEANAELLADYQPLPPTSDRDPGWSTDRVVSKKTQSSIALNFRKTPTITVGRPLRFEDQDLSDMALRYCLKMTFLDYEGRQVSSRLFVQDLRLEKDGFVPSFIGNQPFETVFKSSFFGKLKLGAD